MLLYRLDCYYVFMYFTKKVVMYPHVKVSIDKDDHIVQLLIKNKNTR